jgi:pyruvate/2-oxoglutarate/acetoin dehydrogenase E1 component
MPQKSIRQALNEALAQEMRRDATVIVIGEDVAGGAGSEGQRDAYGGVLGVTKGLIGEFGEATRRSPSRRSWARPRAPRSLACARSPS